MTRSFAFIQNLTVLMLLLSTLGCNSRYLAETPDGFVGVTKMAPHPTGEIVTKGDYRVAMVQIAEQRSAGHAKDIVVIDFAIEYVGDEEITRWNTSKFRYRDSTGNVHAPEIKAVGTLSQTIQISQYFSYANNDLVKNRFGKTAIIDRQLQPGKIPLDTTAIHVEFGINDDSQVFTLPIEWY